MLFLVAILWLLRTPFLVARDAILWLLRTVRDPIRQKTV